MTGGKNFRISAPRISKIRQREARKKTFSVKLVNPEPMVRNTDARNAAAATNASKRSSAVAVRICAGQIARALISFSASSHATQFLVTISRWAVILPRGQTRTAVANKAVQFIYALIPASRCGPGKSPCDHGHNFYRVK